MYRITFYNKSTDHVLVHELDARPEYIEYVVERERRLGYEVARYVKLELNDEEKLVQTRVLISA